MISSRVKTPPKGKYMYFFPLFSISFLICVDLPTPDLSDLIISILMPSNFIDSKSLFLIFNILLYFFISKFLEISEFLLEYKNITHDFIFSSPFGKK